MYFQLQQCAFVRLQLWVKVLVSKGWLQLEITVQHYNGKKQTGKGMGEG